jgi:hypothetical protein
MAVGTYPGTYLQEIDNSFVPSNPNASYAAVMGRAFQGIPNSKVLVQSESQLVQTFGVPMVSGSYPLVSAIDYGIYAGIEALRETTNLYYVRLTDGTETYANVTVPTNSSAATSGTYGTVSAAASTAYPNIAGFPDGNLPNNNYDLTIYNGSPAGLRFAAIGPGATGNNIAVAVWTPAISATSLSGFYDWYNKYDSTAISSAASRVGNRVFKVQVFTKLSNQNFDATWWSLTSGSPVETWYGSTNFLDNDPNGNDLFIQSVINGNSKYVYVTSNKTDGTLPAYTTTAFGLTGGNDAGSLSPINASTVWGLFANKETSPVDVAFVTPRTMNSYSDPNEIAALDSLVGQRLDFTGYIQATALTSTSVNSIIQDSSNIVVASNPSYFGKYVGWNLVFDRYNKVRVYLPNGIYGAEVSLRASRVGNPWDAPAGIAVGQLPSGTQNVNLTPAQAGPLYNQYNLNTIKFLNGIGGVIWGQKTAQLLTTARDRLNVRKMLIYVEDNITSILNGFLFTGNTVKARERVSSLINAFLSSVLAGNGVQSFRVVCDNSNNTSTTIAQNILNVAVYIQPTYTIEFISLTVTISSDSVSVSEG